MGIGFGGYVRGSLSLLKDFLRLCVVLLKKPHYLLGILAVVLGIFYLCGVKPQEIPGWWTKTASPAITGRWKEFSAQFQKTTAPMVDSIGNVFGEGQGSLPSVGTGRKAAEKPSAPAEPAFIESAAAGRPQVWGRKINRPDSTSSAPTVPPVASAAPARIRPAAIPANTDLHPAEPALERHGAEIRPMPYYALAEKQAAAPLPEEPAPVKSPIPARHAGRPIIRGAASVTGGYIVKVNGQPFRLRGIRVRPGRNAEAYRVLSRRYNGTVLACVPGETTAGGMTYADCYHDGEDVAQELLDLGLAEEMPGR